jgi:hypothetical protein
MSIPLNIYIFHSLSSLESVESMASVAYVRSASLGDGLLPSPSDLLRGKVVNIFSAVEWSTEQRSKDTMCLLCHWLRDFRGCL